MRSSGIIGPPAVLGVIGGGQLGRMFVQAAHRMGFATAVLTQNRTDPAAAISEHVVEGDVGELGALRELSRIASAVTVEFENVSAAGLRWLERFRPVRPGWRSIWVAEPDQGEAVPGQSWVPFTGLDAAPVGV